MKIVVVTVVGVLALLIALDQMFVRDLGTGIVWLFIAAGLLGWRYRLTRPGLSPDAPRSRRHAKT